MNQTPTFLDAVHLIDDDSLSGWRGLRSGWDYYDEGEGPLPAFAQGFFRLNSDKNKEVYVRRDCNTFDGGRMTYECKMRNVSGDGLYFSFGSRTDSFLLLTTKGEALYAGKKKICDFTYDFHYIKLVLDLASDTFTAFVDTKNCGTFAFTAPSFPFACLKIGYGKKDKGEASIWFSKLYVNYLLFDDCLQPYLGPLPDEYVVKAPKTAKVESVRRVPDPGELKAPVSAGNYGAMYAFTYASTNRKGAKSVIAYPFARSTGKVTFEMKYLQAEKKGKITVALCKGAKNLISVYDEGEELHCCCGCALRAHHLNVWQTLRIVADTESGEATVYLNGKKTKVIDFETPVKSADNFKITYEAYERSQLMFSDMRLWVQPDEPEDYVPAPVVPKKKGDYVVGMNICSLWREGTHFDWDVITPYDDIKPVLGYYDEGLPETADWEIKYFVEHGIDYELYCWYNAENRAPIKTTHLHYAWLDGHFYAKYSHMEKFALLWEALNCVHPRNLDDFKNYIVPYWLDYFFSDDRYMRIDNKAIMSCFGTWCLCPDLGGPENVRAGLQYLRDEVKKLGYDDLIVMGCHESPNGLHGIGFDACHAYHWGVAGNTLEHNLKMNDDYIAQNSAHLVPTISVGFKNVAWGHYRSPLLTSEDLYKGLKHCIDEYLPKFEKGTWKSKLLHLSTWNEYGEGTYMMPSGHNGFAYLDAVRRAICVDEPHEDIVPTEEQKKRICRLHVQSRRILARTCYDVRPLPEQEKTVASYSFKSKKDLNAWEFVGMKNVKIKDGKLTGIAVEDHAYMALKDFHADTADIAYAKIVCTNKSDKTGRPDGYRFLVSSDGKEFPGRRAIAGGCGSYECQEYRLDLDTSRAWVGEINGLRFVPVDKGSFEIQNITFCASVPHPTVYTPDGSQLFYEMYPPMFGKELYLPLDPDSGIYKKLLGCRFEWFKDERRLEVFDEKNTVIIELEKSYVTKNGTVIELARPVFYSDGIPTLAAKDIAVIFGLKLENKGSKYYFSK